MLENEANLQEYQNGRKKKKKMMVSESDGCLMEISSTSTVSLEQLNEGLAASSETQAGKEKHGKKKHKKKMEGDIAEVSAEVSVSESITVGQEEGRKRKRRRKQQGKEEEDGAPVVSETEGALVKERKKKKKKKRSEMSDTAEHASEVPDRETVVAEERVREKKKKRRKDSEMEQDNNTMGAEEMVKKKKRSEVSDTAEHASKVPAMETVVAEEKVREKKKKRREDSEMEQDSNTMGAEEMVKKKKKRSEVSDTAEHASEVPDRETVVAEERVREKKKKRRKYSEMEQDNNTMSAEEMVKKEQSEVSDTAEHASEVPDMETVVAEEKVREKKKKRRKDSEMEQDNNTMGAEEMVKKEQSEVSDTAEHASEVPDMETVVAEEKVREKKKKRRKDSEMEQDNNTMGAEEMVKKEQSEVSDTAEYASEVPDMETVVAEEKVREKKKKRRKDSEMEQDNNTMGAEEMVKKKNNNNNKKKHFEREENGAGESSSMIPSDDLKEQGTQYKLNSKTQKLTTAYAVEMDLEGEEENISVSAQNFMDASMRKCIEELKKFIPNVETKSPSVISHLVKYDLSRFKILSQEGESFKSGRFSAEENEKLFRNIKDFLALTGISSAAKLFFTNRYPEEAAQIRNMKKLHKFHSQIAVGIFRSWHEIYSRGRKVFDEFNYKGRYTEDELKKLNKLQNLYGNNWMKISELTGRSNISLEKRFSQIAHKKGEWTVSEQKKLMRIIKEYMVTQVEPKDGPSGLTIRKEKLYSNVPWKSVSEGMETRSWVQCRVKWMAILKQKMTCGADVYKGRKSLQAKIRLIRALYEMDVEDSSDVKWEDLTFTIGDVPPAYIQAKFYKLKVTQVPLWQSKSFSDIIDFLYNKVLPKLEKDLKNCEEESVLPKDIFCLSQIFDAD
ncbi:uncharacterized protein [Paramormyrops kingsleyae]|uniref:uncharacterized protein isoform X1 n=1 Tax=Paramormyrops kingsleyae TaxID=1676925 RepID=UPI003B97B4A0